MGNKLYLILMISFLILGIIGGAYSFYWNYLYTKNYEYSLKLTDDASLPEQKAQYLKQYRSDINEIIRNPRYVFMTPDLELSKQKEILDGLIKRFDDLSQMSPDSFAYQQGMEQLTGQEMNHQLDRISSIFREAKVRENFFNFLIVEDWWMFFIIPFILLCILPLWAFPM